VAALARGIVAVVISFQHVLTNIAADLPTAKRGWTTAQHLDHCADSIVASMVGYPQLKPAIVRGTIGKLLKRRFLARGAMKHDTAAPLPGGTVPISREVAEARAALEAAIERFRKHVGPLAPHPFYGDCTAEEYEQLHAIHVADHLRSLRDE
jgi:hypothetical protein